MIKSKGRQKGFTMIELIMVIVILAILVAIAVPRYLDLSTQARESATRAALGGIRAAVAIQYASNVITGGSYPATIDSTMFADSRIPPEQVVATGTNSTASSVVSLGTGSPTATVGGWFYNSTAGTVVINTTGTQTTW